MKKILSIIAIITLIALSLVAFSSCMPTSADSEGGGMGQWISIGLMLIVLVGLFVFMGRGNKKKEKEAARLRDELAVDDEITTIGGIVGRVVSISEQTLVIETTRDKTHIRIMKWAIKTVDVKAADPIPTESEAPAEGEENTDDNKSGGKKNKKMKD